jgi:hypothetical protein
MARNHTTPAPWRIHTTRLTSRRHVDLARVHSALCSA